MKIKRNVPLILKVLAAVSVLQVSGFFRGPRIINMTRVNEIMKLSFLGKDPGLNFLLTALFEEQSCTDLTVHGLGLSKGIRIGDIFIQYSATYEQLLLKGSDHETGYSLCLRDTSEPMRDTCAIPEDMKCDGFSTCLNDECGCERDRFKCADGMGCVTIQQLCDSRPDCLDLSDEIPCQDFQNCKRSLRPVIETGTDNTTGLRSCNKNSNISKTDEMSALQTFFFGPDAVKERLDNNYKSNTT